ncbi:phosphomannomutase/phosphoglucomutase [Jiangella endophytica]|uniref:phosphomannomutase/phosphoglucomutase n=1 Tax=Jiangella endophytica TaxID=1623398 RepID=UPI000E35388D|nr:phosphomannomutase/phosphoglucomutase [Jiangella endophytica]
MRDLVPILKAYDIRGVVPDELDDETVRAIGWAAAHVLADGSGAMVVGHDMRPTSPQLSEAFADGVTAAGVDVVMAGLTSTDQLYYASGALGLPGAMFTASHNPARYNGIKLCRSEAAPVGYATGLAEIKALIDDGVDAPVAARGRVEHRDTLHDYAAHLHSLVDLGAGRPITVVVDAGNGMAGHTVPAVLDLPGLTVVPLYFELDGTFPNHEANPIDPANLVDLRAAVREHGADLGLAFDGDADRCFVVDERGEPVSPSALTALIAVRELGRVPGSSVVHNLITSKAVPEIIAEHGGTPVRTRVGHSLIKQTMAETGAVFGGEHSGHFYFRDFWRADSGMLAALHTLAALRADDAGRPLSQLLTPYERYAASGEINSTVADAEAVTARVEETFGKAPDVVTDRLDGLTVEHTGTPMWWFNLRPSNTEPLLRLNVEGADRAVMERVRDDVLRVVRGQGEGAA